MGRRGAHACRSSTVRATRGAGAGLRVAALFGAFSVDELHAPSAAQQQAAAARHQKWAFAFTPPNLAPPHSRWEDWRAAPQAASPSSVTIGWAVPGSNGRPPACKARAGAAVCRRLSLSPPCQRWIALGCCALLRFGASTALPLQLPNEQSAYVRLLVLKCFEDAQAGGATSGQDRGDDAGEDGHDHERDQRTDGYGELDVVLG